jgi:hypothetical protein
MGKFLKNCRGAAFNLDFAGAKRLVWEVEGPKTTENISAGPKAGPEAPAPGADDVKKKREDYDKAKTKLLGKCDEYDKDPNPVVKAKAAETRQKMAELAKQEALNVPALSPEAIKTNLDKINGILDRVEKEVALIKVADILK